MTKGMKKREKGKQGSHNREKCCVRKDARDTETVWEKHTTARAGCGMQHGIRKDGKSRTG